MGWVACQGVSGCCRGEARTMPPVCAADRRSSPSHTLMSRPTHAPTCVCVCVQVLASDELEAPLRTMPYTAEALSSLPSPCPLPALSLSHPPSRLRRAQYHWSHLRLCCAGGTPCAQHTEDGDFQETTSKQRQCWRATGPCQHERH